MPINNLTQQKVISKPVLSVSSFLGRLIGLIGTHKPDHEVVLYFQSTSSIHTFGMRYPVDLVFLNKNNEVLKKIFALSPRRFTKIVKKSHSVLESPTGTLDIKNIKVGDKLHIISDNIYRPDITNLRTIFHWPINTLLALLWANFVLGAIKNWLNNGTIVGAGLVIVNTLFVLLFLTRRASNKTTQNFADWLIAIVTVGLSLNLKIQPVSSISISAISGIVQTIGILAIFFSSICLGRSFGVVPANRKVKSTGSYQIVRHPMYSSEMLFYCGFLIGNFSAYNVSLGLLMLVGQLYRASAEEKLLAKDINYKKYLANVKYRFVPGIY